MATLPFNLLYSRFGAKLVFSGAGLISIVSTFFIPIVSNLGMVPFIVMRFFQGVAFAANFACIGMVTSRWACLGKLFKNGILFS